MNKSQVLDFIKSHTIAVMATISPEGSPEAAVIEFAETEDFELIFDTFNTYRKYKNIKNNPNVAFVIGWDKNITVQYEGVAQELVGDELEKYKKIYFAKNPDAKKWQKFPEITHFKVRPKWLRYRDGNTVPPTVSEFSF